MVNFKTAGIKTISSSDLSVFAVEPHYGTFSWAKSVHTSLDREVREQKRKYSTLKHTYVLSRGEKDKYFSLKEK